MIGKAITAFVVALVLVTFLGKLGVFLAIVAGIALILS